MKQLTCEMCGSTDLMKQDGVFVCQTCGCKYSVEEAKKMMVEGTVDVSGSTVKVDNTDAIVNYLTIGENAILAGNGKIAETYANKALEIEPKNPSAWKLKMESYEYTAVLGDLQIPDVIVAGLNVIEYSDNKEKAEEDIYNYFLTRALSLLEFATSQLDDTYELRKTKKEFAFISILSASNNTAKVDANEADTYDAIAQSALQFIDFIPQDAIERYSELKELLRKCATTFEAETEALSKRLKIYMRFLTQDTINNRKAIVEKIKDMVGITEEEYEQIYKNACSKLELNYFGSVELALKQFEKISSYRDSAEKIEECKEKLEKIRTLDEQEEQKEKKFERVCIITIVVVFIVMFIMFFVRSISDNNTANITHQNLVEKTFSDNETGTEDYYDYTHHIAVKFLDNDNMEINEQNMI